MNNRESGLSHLSHKHSTTEEVLTPRGESIPTAKYSHCQDKLSSRFLGHFRTSASTDRDCESSPLLFGDGWVQGLIA